MASEMCHFCMANFKCIQMEALMNDVMTALSAIEELKWIDDDLGQLTQPDPAVNFPCALIGIGNVDRQDYGANGQFGDFILDITLGLRAHLPEATETPQKIHPYATELYRLIHKIDNALYALEGEAYGPLTRIRITADRNRYPATFTLSYSTVLYQ